QYVAPGVPLFDAFFGPEAGGQLAAEVNQQLANQHANPRSSYDDGIGGGIEFTKNRSIMNDTSYSFGPFTLRNIFGYRKIFTRNAINTGAVGELSVTGQAFNDLAGL